MAAINPLARELVFKIVFYGPGLGGKTTSLQHVHDRSRPEHRGKMVSLATAVDRTLYFDFLPLRVPKIRGMGVRLQLFTVPGQVYYNATRKLVLTGADGVVFVADSQAARADANLESFENLRENLAEHKRELAGVPHVFQYNKRDLAAVLSVEDLDRALNPLGAPAVPTIATLGEGVFETLELITRAVLSSFDRSLPDEPSSSMELSLAEGGLVDALRGAEAAAGERVIAVVTENFLDTPGRVDDDPLFDSGPPMPAEPHVAIYPPSARSLEGPPPGERRTPVSGVPAAEGEVAGGAGEGASARVTAETEAADESDAVLLANTDEHASPPEFFDEVTDEMRRTPRASVDLEGGTLSGTKRPTQIPSDRETKPSEADAAVPTARGHYESGVGVHDDENERAPRPSQVPAAFSFSAIWEGDGELVRDVEAAIASGARRRAVDLLDVLATRTLAATGALLGGVDAPRDSAVVVMLLGLAGPRYLAYRALVHNTRAGAEPDEHAVLAAYAYVLELRLARSRSGL